jgi:hypothetical protein
MAIKIKRTINLKENVIRCLKIVELIRKRSPVFLTKAQ